MTVTCPRYPAVPLSIRGMSAAKHILFTWLRAAAETKSPLHLNVFTFRSNKENVCLVRSHENTSVIQSIHHQHKLSKELHVVVRAVGGGKDNQLESKSTTISVSV